MAAYTYHQLKEKTVAELRDLAKDLQHEAVQGYSQMNKEHLLPALCKVLGVDTHEHHVADGIDKAGIKAKIKMLKAQRDKALDAHDHDALKATRRQLHHLNRQIRAHLS
jgi:DNA-binding IclR family transcriptional regulator